MKEVLGSASHALLGRVTPSLRAVYITFESEETRLTFYYDKPPTEDEFELASLAHTDVICDFPDDFNCQCYVRFSPYPELIPNQGHCIYHRFEGEIA